MTTFPIINNFQPERVAANMAELQKLTLAQTISGVLTKRTNETLTQELIDVVPSVGVWLPEIKILSNTGYNRYDRNVRTGDIQNPLASAVFPPILNESEQLDLLTYPILEVEDEFDVNLSNVIIPSIEEGLTPLGDIESLGYFPDIALKKQRVMNKFYNAYYFKHLKFYATSSNYVTASASISGAAGGNFFTGHFTTDTGGTILSLKATGVNPITQLKRYVFNMDRLSSSPITHILIARDVADYLTTYMSNITAVAVGFNNQSTIALANPTVKRTMERDLSVQLGVNVVINDMVARNPASGVVEQAQPDGSIAMLSIPTKAELNEFQQNLNMLRKYGSVDLSTYLTYNTGLVAVKDTTRHILTQLEWDTMQSVRERLGVTPTSMLQEQFRAMKAEELSGVRHLQTNMITGKADFTFVNGLKAWLKLDEDILKFKFKHQYSDMIKPDKMAGGLLLNMLVAS